MDTAALLAALPARISAMGGTGCASTRRSVLALLVHLARIVIALNSFLFLQHLVMLFLVSINDGLKIIIDGVALLF